MARITRFSPSSNTATRPVSGHCTPSAVPPPSIPSSVPFAPGGVISTSAIPKPSRVMPSPFTHERRHLEGWRTRWLTALASLNAPRHAYFSHHLGASRR